MQRVALASETAGQVGIPLPIAEIRAWHRIVTTSRETAVGQRIGKNIARPFLEFGAPGKVPTLVSGVTPSAVFCPMPRAHPQFGIVAVGNRSPACRERFLNNVWRMNLVDPRARQHIKRAPQCANGVERVQDVLGVCIDVHRCDRRELVPLYIDLA